MPKEKDDKIIVLSRPYTFEDKTITEIDLRGIEDLDTTDLIEIDDILIDKGVNPAMSGLTFQYAIIVANRVSKLPLEFLEKLKAKDSLALKNEVGSFFYGED